MQAGRWLDKGMPDLPNEVKEIWATVRDQAASHTTRDRGVRIMSSYRPNRTERVKEYQESNFRALTMGEFRKVKTKLSRVIRSNGAQITYQGAKLTEWLASLPFTVLHQRSDLWNWVYESVLSESLEDPNAVIVCVPVYTDDVPPAAPIENGGLPENELPNIDVRIISSDDIKFLSKDLVVWRTGISYVDKKGNYETYFAIDRSGFWEILPTVQGDKVVYQMSLWYAHASDQSLFATMAGNISRVGRYRYNESVAHPFFEYGDEFISVFQDSQSVSVEHIYPKTIVSGNLPCPEEGCINGKIKIQHGTVQELKTCKTCRGTGEISNPAPFGYLKRPRSEKNDAPPPIQYLYPSTEIVKISYDRAFDLLLKAKQSMGLDLIGQVAESGAAKLYRLEDLEDMIQAFASGLFECIRQVLERAEEILEMNPAERLGVTYTLPSTFNVSKSSPEQLANEFKISHMAVRLKILQQMVETKYGDDDLAKYKIELAALASKVFLMTPEEQQMAVAMGAASPEDIESAQEVLRVIEQLTLTLDKETDLAAVKSAMDELEGSSADESDDDRPDGE